jgi:hypothetical protein
MRLVVLAAPVLALACLPASAQGAGGFYSGNDLRTLCADAGKNNLNFGLCFGFVVAIADALASTDGAYGWRACFPANSTVGQDVAVVKRYLDQHPDRRHYGAGGLVADALGEAFPCKP